MAADNKSAFPMRLCLSLGLTTLKVGAHVRTSLVGVLGFAALVRTVLDRDFAALVW